MRKKRREGKKGRKDSLNAEIEPTTSYSAANVATIKLPPLCLIACTYYSIYIAIHDLTVAALATLIMCACIILRLHRSQLKTN